MLQPNQSPTSCWTAADLVERFGPIPLLRIGFDPPPGLASEADLLEIARHGDRPFELIDGVLVEKTKGNHETFLAVQLITILNLFVRENDLGLITAPDGRFRIMPEQIRMPDVAFIRWDRLPSRAVPEGAAFECGFDLAVEVISPSNTAEEMDSKLAEYFEHGTRLVWYVYPRQREVHVFTSPSERTTVLEGERLTGGEVLPGFELSLSELFGQLGEAKD